MPPEVNKFCEINIKNNEKRDFLSMGIILLFFMSKNKYIFEEMLKQKLEGNLEKTKKKNHYFNVICSKYHENKTFGKIEI